MSTITLPRFMPDDLARQSAPRQRWALVRPLIPKRLQPLLRGVRKRVERRRVVGLVEPFRTVYPYTQVDHTRQRNLLRVAGIVERERVIGACIECGVLDGGTAALVAHATRGSGRAVHLFDAWEGLPGSTEQDGPDARRWKGEVVGSPRRVARVMSRMGVAPARVTVHKGWFHETFPEAHVPRIALAHIDADFYEATKLCLHRWYPHLSPGGFMQFDDYDSFRGCRQAVEEFLAEHPELRLETFGELKAKAYYFRKPRR
ncbi:MAG TPA: TylF/MycF/NovP-related O-methyltransferase, partial [Tepidisphaeraceae bacterium]|nr:TylF/MycF/NovP-related O-methyltransferase [Tepidisphaeraceae bacterium]